MTEAATDGKKPLTGKNFQFQIAIPDLSKEPILHAWISEVHVREGAEFLSFSNSSRTLSIDSDAPRSISVVQSLYGPATVTWYLLTCDRYAQNDKLEDLALGCWVKDSNQRTYLLPDLLTLEAAIELLPAPSHTTRLYR